MYRLMAFLKRQPHLTYDAFVAHYENWHAPWGYHNFCAGHVRRYVRNYVQHPKDGPEAAFDVITEFWFNSEADYHAWVTAKQQHPMAAALTADENSFFDRALVQTAVVEPVETLRPIPAERPEPGVR
jgi:hypothetical protein